MGPLYFVTLIPPATIPVLVFATIMWVVGRIGGRTLVISAALVTFFWAVSWWIGLEIEAARARMGL
jgi:hypothetical protein